MPNPTRAGQVQHLLRLIDACPGPCRVVFYNPALPSGIVVHIPADEPAMPADNYPQPSEEVAGVPGMLDR
jgi:hypothetical protein